MEGAVPRSREMSSTSRLGGARRGAGPGKLKLAGAGGGAGPGGSRSRGCRGSRFGMEEEPRLEVEGGKGPRARPVSRRRRNPSRRLPWLGGGWAGGEPVSRAGEGGRRPERVAAGRRRAEQLGKVSDLGEIFLSPRGNFAESQTRQSSIYFTNYLNI